MLAETNNALSSVPSEQERTSTREAILTLQDCMAQFPQSMPPVSHYFAPGVYAREMLIPKDVYIVGKIHKHAHLNIIQYGHVQVITEFGIKELKGPLTFTSEPGTKRAVHALEDTLWTTIHVTEETDLEKIEDFVIAKSYDELNMICNNAEKEFLK